MRKKTELVEENLIFKLQARKHFSRFYLTIKKFSFLKIENNQKMYLNHNFFSNQTFLTNLDRY